MTQALLEKRNTGEDDVSQYLRDIRQYPLLSPEQERKLAMDCAQGDEDAIRTMVNSNLRLVVSIAREYAGRGVPLLDLIQEGSIGLLAAAKKFDYTMECRFSTYAAKWIRQGVNRCVLNHSGVIRVPLHTMERMRKIIAARASLQQQTGQEPDAGKLAAYTEIPQDKVEALMELLPRVCSLDAPVGEQNEALSILLEDVQTPQPQEALIRRELKGILDSLLEKLTERQRQVLRLRFGMEDGICHSFEQIGQMLGISKERARQIEHRATDKLYALGADLGLEEFLNG